MVYEDLQGLLRFEHEVHCLHGVVGVCSWL